MRRLLIPFIIAIFIAVISLIGTIPFFSILEKQILYMLSIIILAVIIIIIIYE